MTDESTTDAEIAAMIAKIEEMASLMSGRFVPDAGKIATFRAGMLRREEE